MKAELILKEHHAFIEQVEEYLLLDEKVRAYGTTLAKQKAAAALRNVKVAIAKYRLTAPKPTKASIIQRGLNLLVR
jgi:hypothetical protein